MDSGVGEQDSSDEERCADRLRQGLEFWDPGEGVGSSSDFGEQLVWGSVESSLLLVTSASADVGDLQTVGLGLSNWGGGTRKASLNHSLPSPVRDRCSAAWQYVRGFHSTKRLEVSSGGRGTSYFTLNFSCAIPESQEIDLDVCFYEVHHCRVSFPH